MKYKTFARLRGVGCLGLVALCGFGCVNWVKSYDKPAPPPTNAGPRNPAPADPGPANPEPNSPAPANPNPPANPPTAGDLALTPVDKDILVQQKSPLTNGTSDGKSRKWRQKANGMTLELRSDTDKGSTTWNRAKVDLNNNKMFEELWDFKPDGSVKKRVAPADDENYTTELRLKPGASQWERVK